MAKTKNLVKASARIITITELSEGDVYQRLEGNSDLRYGVVTQVLHNGEDAVIQALEVTEGMYYSGPTAELKTFGTDSDVKIFPADPLHVQLHLGKVRQANGETLVRAERALSTAQDRHDSVLKVLERFEGADLTAASVTYGGVSDES